MTSYVLKYSHNIIEHLGLKLYQNKPTNVIAELVSNSWDADAKNAWIDIISDNGNPLAIIATDNGKSMSDAEIKSNWLVIAKKKEVERVANTNSRKPMGRKGIGKLAPFGIGKKVDLITFKDNKLNWLALNYLEMVSESGTELISYEPRVITQNSNDFFSSSINDYLNTFPDGLKNKIRERLDIISKSHGTIILCHDLSLRRVISEKQLKESLGRRFTVTLNTPSFEVAVNGQKLEEIDCLPKWELRIPSTGMDVHEIKIPKKDKDGNEFNIIKEIRSWVGFTSTAELTQEQSGIGVFAHGKLAQDRPFTFGSRGLEIKTRYMYGVVEADWIDELEEDIISTDRTSIDWDYADLESFSDWGKKFVRSSISAFDEHKREKLEAEMDGKIEKAISKTSQTSIRSSEKKHLSNLLLEVLPESDLDETQQQQLIEATAKAWIHEPARKLIKSLWDETSHFESNNFAEVINKLVDELVPESLSLAVVFSQRVYALTQLYRRIQLGKETQLQKLIEEFPWILGNDYNHFFPNRQLKTICEEAEQKGLTPLKHLLAPEPADSTRPDFVFLSTASDKEYMVVELKGPEATIGASELQQLHSYVMYIRQRSLLTNSQVSVKGVLVAGDFNNVIHDDMPKSISYITWNDILLQSRHNHMELLAALLAGTDTDPNDSRIKQICELGGNEVTDFLDQMSKNNTDLAEIMSLMAKSNV